MGGFNPGYDDTSVYFAGLLGYYVVEERASLVCNTGGGRVSVLYDARGHYLITIRKLNYNFVLKALFNSQLLQYTFSREMQSCFMAKLV